MLINRVKNIIAHSLAERQRVLIALSGGADSSAILNICANIKNLYLEAAHCNFHLRGDESIRDQKHCQKLCRQLGIKLHTVDFDVAAYRKEKGGSVEMACRELRYNFFINLCKEQNLNCVITGHNSDDNCETFLLNLMRGAGTKGLSAMSVESKLTESIKLLRPLLTTSREEIISYLETLNICWVDDHTNFENEYSRNFMRNEVIPLLKKRWPNAKGSILRSILNLQGADKTLSSIYPAVNCEGGIIFWDAFNNDIDLDTQLTYYFRNLTPNMKVVQEISREITKHRAENIKLGTALSGRRWKLSDSYFVFAERDGLHILPDDTLPLPQNATLTPIEAGFKLDKVRLDKELWRGMISDKTNHSLYISPVNYKKLKFRKWQTADRIESLGMKGSQLVSDIFSDAKLSRLERSEILLAVDYSDRIVWIPRLKRSRLYLLSKEDKEAVKISIEVS